MSETVYYSLDEIKTKKDLDGEEPYIYIITGNKSAGKTTAVLLEGLSDFKETGRQMLLIYREKNELSSANMLFGDVLEQYPEYGTEMSIKPCADGLFYQLFLDGKDFGYAVTMFKFDKLKKYSPVFRKTYTALFDEIQKEDGAYLKDEPEKLMGLLMAVARGGGKQSRPMKLYLLGNTVSLMNPYFIKFGIYKRLKPDTRFLRGKGWIAEFLLNESAQNAIKENPLFKAFLSDDYFAYSTESKYMYNTDEFIQHPTGKSKYLFTLKINNEFFAVRDYYEQGKIAFTRDVDKQYKYTLCINSQDHNDSTILVRRNSYLVESVREAYELGLLIFSDLSAKNAALELLAIDFYRKA